MTKKLPWRLRPAPFRVADLVNPVERRWPKKGDQLIQAPVSWRSAAEFTQSKMARSAYFWNGYMVAGAALIDEVARQPYNRNVLLYPILFNYRHGLETAMKWIIERYGEVGVKNGHNLLALWEQCRTILEPSAAQVGETETLAVVEQIIKDLHDIDEHGVSFLTLSTRMGT